MRKLTCLNLSMSYVYIFSCLYETVHIFNLIINQHAIFAKFM
jgi:hypothetical protein